MISEDFKLEKSLLINIREIILSARLLTRKSINYLQVISNFLIGRSLVENEQKGKQRASYGKQTLKNLAILLTSEFGKGYSETNLEYMRKFYRVYKTRIDSIPQTVSEEFKVNKTQTLSEDLSPSELAKFVTGKFTLSWSHYLFLMNIDNEEERAFYEKEAFTESWSLRELKRQFDSSLYERLALSKDKQGVKDLSVKGQLVEKQGDIIKEPYVLEFLGLDEKTKYSETELETAIINRLEQFLLELGKGFLFEARQKRLTFEEDHFFVDLVFYNRLLHCYVLIDLKIGELKHQDLGQMQMYVNYFDRYVKLENEQPTIGIILCKKKKDSLVEITLPKDANIHAAKYQTYLPSKKELKKQMEEVQVEWEASIP